MLSGIVASASGRDAAAVRKALGETDRPVCRQAAPRLVKAVGSEDVCRARTGPGPRPAAAPPLAKAGTCGRSWFVDETYLRVRAAGAICIWGVVRLMQNAGEVFWPGMGSRSRRNSGDLAPDLEGISASSLVITGRQAMPTKLEMVVDPAVGGEETLGVVG